MVTTPLWVPLVVAATGVVGTLTGVIFTQVWNRSVDDRRWARERNERREERAREDANRTYEYRRAAYVEFLQEFYRLQSLYPLRVSGNEHAPREHAPDVVLDTLTDRYMTIMVYGTKEAADLADKCLEFVTYWVYTPEEIEVTANDTIPEWKDFLSQIRKDLGVPEQSSKEVTATSSKT